MIREISLLSAELLLTSGVTAFVKGYQMPVHDRRPLNLIQDFIGQTLDRPRGRKPRGSKIELAAAVTLWRLRLCTVGLDRRQQGYPFESSHGYTPIKKRRENTLRSHRTMQLRITVRWACAVV